MKITLRLLSLTLAWLLLGYGAASATPTVPPNQSDSLSYNAGRTRIALSAALGNGRSNLSFSLTSYTRNSAIGELYIRATSTTPVNTTNATPGTTISGGATPEIYFVPASTAVASKSFNLGFTATDTNGGGNSPQTSAPQTFTVTITSTVPVANNDAATTSLNQPLSNINILGNDTDADGNATIDPATVVLGTQTNGVFTVVTAAGADQGKVNFTPNNNFGGTATVSYTVKDEKGLVSNSGTLTVTVTNPPTANSDDAQTPLGTAINNINVLGNDTGGSGMYVINPATVTLVGTQVGGAFTRNATTGTISFTPNASFVGAASVNYTVNNQKGETSNQATLTVVVTKAPTAVNDAITVSYRSNPVAITILDNDTPASADGANAVNPTSVVLGAVSPGNGGSFAVNSNGIVTFTPPSTAYVGNTTVTYTVKNNASPAQASTAATITVTLTNAAPVAVSDNVTTVKDRPMTNINVLSNDKDADGNATLDKSSVVLSTPSNGTFTVNNAAGSTQGTINFTPTAGFVGNASVLYTVKDERGTISNQVYLTVAVAATSVDVVTTLDGPTSAPAGSYVTYTISVRNNSGAAANDVSPRVQLPTGLQTVTASLDATYNPSSGIVIFSAANYAANSTSQTATVRFIMPASGTVTGVASSISSSAAFTTPSSNDGSASTSQVTTSATQVADVATTITGPTATAPGGKTVLNIVASNYGPSTATNVVLRATISKNLTDATVSGGGSYDPGTGIITVPAITSLETKASTGFTVSFTAPRSSDQPVKGTVSATCATPDPALSNNDGSADFSNITTSVSNTVASQACLTTSTTDLTTTANQQLNTYYTGLQTVNANSTTLTVGPALSATGATNIAPGDLVLILQMQGAQIDYSNTNAYGDGVASTDSPANGTLGTSLTAGLYEYRYVASTSSTVTPTAGGTVTLSSPLTNTYQNAEATATAGQQRFQVIVVPRFRNLTLGADLSPAAWNGKTGGVLVLEVGGTLDFNGYTINASGKGFRGGAGRMLTGTGTATTSYTNTDYVTPASAPLNASKGEGIVGTPRFVNNNGALLDNTLEGYPNGSYGRGAPGNAGGGGTDGRV
ncbi:MAG TPA: Ig-like domain-containing protein, partial [Hymenobacter sp.]